MNRELQHHPVHAVNRTRLEFLFDGVFAIAMTILVLELKVPELTDRRSVGELLVQLSHHGRAFFSYGLSFAVLGTLWYSHHVVFRCLQRITYASYVLHIVMMAAAAFFPFCAALLGRYPSNPAIYPMYFGSVWLYQASACALLLLANRQGTLDPGLGPELLAGLRQQYVRSTLILSVLFASYSVFVGARAAGWIS